MRTTYRIGTAFVALCAAFPIGLSPAYAADAKPPLTGASWYWAEQDKSTPLPIPGQTLPPAASGIPDKDLGVAYTGDSTDQPDKETFLSWSLAGVPLEATVDAFTFTMKLDPSVPTNTPWPQQEAPALVTCLAQRGFLPNQLGAPFTERPIEDCSNPLTSRYDATAKAYIFDIAPYAQLWANGEPSLGVGIRHVPKSTTAFQLAFLPASTITASISYREKVAVAPPPPTTPPVTPTIAPPPPPPSDTGGGGTALPPTTAFGSGALGSGPIVQAPAPQPQAAPAPRQVSLAPVVPVAPAAATPFTPDQRLPLAFWLVALALVVLMGLASVVLGQPDVEARGARRQVRGLGRRLAQQPAAGPRHVSGRALPI